MQVSFNPNVSFRQQQTAQTVPVKSAQPIVVQNNKQSSSFKENVSNVAKFFTNAKEFLKASGKAIVYSAATAITCLAGFWTFGTFPRAFKDGNSLRDAFKHPIKNISTKGKVITALATSAVAAFHMIKGRLTANQRTANVDHQLRTGHRSF